MKALFSYILLVLISFLLVQCKHVAKEKTTIASRNEVQYAKGFTLENFKGYSVVTVKNPWPNASKNYIYILKEKNGSIPDSLKQNTIISIPIKKIIVTSTTHLPSLEMLGVERTLLGFPHLNYISSDKIWKLIEAGSIKELGSYQSLNTEQIINMQPDVVIGHGIDNNNPALDNLEKSGLKVMLNGDWNEATPLGNAEWIKFFGALYGKQKEAQKIFTSIEKEYLRTIDLVQKIKTKPTVLAGDLYEDRWYLPKGSSWGSLLLKEAQGNYLWQETSGTGSLSLSFETVFEHAKNADVWITSGQFSSLNEMRKANPHYSEFDAFKTKNVYSFTAKKGKKGGNLYYELGPSRPDIVLKDLIKILHPEVLPNDEPFFFEKLK